MRVPPLAGLRAKAPEPASSVMKRKTRSFFEDRYGSQREYDPADASGQQLRYPHEWLEELPPDAPARAQHDRLLALHARVYELIQGHPRLQEYFDTGPVDGSGFRVCYAEDAPAYADGNYPTDLVEWSDMLQTMLCLIDLEYQLDDDEGETPYFDQEAREVLRAPLKALDADVAAFIKSLEHGPEPVEPEQGARVQSEKNGAIPCGE